MKPHTLAALRKMLSKRLTEEDLFEITFHTQGIEDNPAKQALYSLLFNEDKRVSNNAAWVFTHFDLHSKPTAVRVLCMKLAYEQCKFFPDLLTELRAGLEIMEPALLPAALKTARRNLLKKL